MKADTVSFTKARFWLTWGGWLLAVVSLAMIPAGNGSLQGTGPDRNLKTADKASAKPVRVVSICLQGDQYLLQMVSRDRIAALSFLATDPDISVHWAAAAGFPLTSGRAEEVIRLKPDLVLVSVTSDPLTVSMIRSCGVKTVELGIPNDFKELASELLLAGRALGEEEKAGEIVHGMNDRLARLEARRAPVGKRPTALFYFHDRFTPGVHTFANAILETAGYRNMAASFSEGLGVSVSMESVVMARPNYLILTKFRENSPTHTELSETDPIFQKLGSETKVISVSFRNLVLPDPANLDLAEMLQQKICK